MADRLMVRSWTHHLRHFNKMADALANIAIDSKTSKQAFAADVPDLPQNWSSVVTFLQGDVDHWIDTLCVYVSHTSGYGGKLPGLH
ncbi:hypothetical protein PHYSODRAFT_353397 [Phytophthora sojae]|uniref:RNase H type-1 domain-containing protein n=1 Tax=Phytophthora sojae (strain P6497) TaxID=1094619 RepID=G4YEM6_PHYSP|nr:hypothetical protein PHYSODRAFT_353397 [Phytophthora sojae]EGZ27303.1 hypothetical protein PHYSODRAFT_353397 [Phytophthora sojae]|eukprot:XP_009514578.1 hypothetical protein PHYSODRAFT_353397 [Phytophthora sojae]